MKLPIKFYIILSIAVAMFLVSNPVFSQQFAFTKDTLNLGQIDSNLIRAYTNIKSKDAWEAIEHANTIFTRKIKIAIVDSGVDSGHPEFNNPKVDLGIHPDAFFDHDPLGHGTQINGIIGANNISANSPSNYVPSQMNGILSGVKNLDYNLANVFDGGLNDNGPNLAYVLNAIYLLTTLENVDIVNLSHSFSYPDCNFIQTEALKLVFSPAFSAHFNTLFITSAGETTPMISNANCFLPGALGDRFSNVINVGGLNLNGDGRWSGSPSGSTVNISAPAENVYAPAPRGKGNYSSDTKNYDTIFGGTSASAPMVTGVAGLIKAIKPELTPGQIKDILVRNADPIQTDKPIGGRLNAFKAVCDPMVLNCAPTPPPTAPTAWPMLQKNAQHTGLADVAGPPFATSTAVNIKWQKPLGLLTSFPLLIDRGKIYVGAGFNLLAFDATDGNQLWQTSIPAGAESGAVGPDGTIYVCGLNSNLQSVLTAVDANSHQIKWQFNVGFFRPCNSPVVDKNGVIYTSVPPAFNAQMAAAVAVNPDGTPKWRYEEGNIATTPPALSNDESLVYVVFFNRLLAFNSATGQIAWAQNLPVATGFPNLPVVDKDERILILNPSNLVGGFITAFSKSGAVLWQKSSNAFFISLYPDSKIAAVSLSDLSLLNSSDGVMIPNSKISFPANSMLLSSVPPAVDINGLVYIPLKLSDASAGLAVLGANGLRWTFSVPATGFIATGGSALGSGNRLYFSVQGTLFSFGQ